MGFYRVPSRVLHGFHQVFIEGSVIKALGFMVLALADWGSGFKDGRTAPKPYTHEPKGSPNAFFNEPKSLSNRHASSGMEDSSGCGLRSALLLESKANLTP